MNTEEELNQLIDYSLKFGGYRWAGGSPYHLSVRLKDFDVNTSEDILEVRAAMFWEVRQYLWDKDDCVLNYNADLILLNKLKILKDKIIDLSFLEE